MAIVEVTLCSHPKPIPQAHLGKIHPRLSVEFAAVVPRLVTFAPRHALIKLAPLQTEVEAGTTQSWALAKPVAGQGLRPGRRSKRSGRFDYRIGRECRCAGYDYKRSRKARYARCKSQSSSCPFRLTQQYKAISCKPSFLPSRFGECVSLTAVHVKNVGMSPASIWSNILGAQKGELSHCERSTSLNY